ncbi:MAG: spondin domain-containing protein [Gemmatimonadota bacterium]|nr:MAG: spondin domain-containing protein [Gemmatimonadota bacterium]
MGARASWPISGDVTSQLMLWDAGTEVNQKPGIGLDQAPRQSGPDSGAAESATVRLVDDGFTYPGVSDVINVTITPIM